MSGMAVKALRPFKAMRAMCLRCQGNRYSQVRRCETHDCPLWAYRFGHRPGTAPRTSKPITADGGFDLECGGDGDGVGRGVRCDLGHPGVSGGVEDGGMKMEVCDEGE